MCVFFFVCLIQAIEKNQRYLTPMEVRKQKYLTLPRGKLQRIQKTEDITYIQKFKKKKIILYLEIGDIFRTPIYFFVAPLCFFCSLFCSDLHEKFSEQVASGAGSPLSLIHI